jgi:hypothetical protein
MLLCASTKSSAYIVEGLLTQDAAYAISTLVSI